MEPRFEIQRTPEGVVDAEVQVGHVLIRRVAQEGGHAHEALLLDIPRDVLRRLTEWVDAERISVTLAGPLAEQARLLAKEMGMSPQNFVLLAVNSFIEAGEGR